MDSMYYFINSATQYARHSGDTGLLIQCMMNQAVAMISMNMRLEGAELLTETITYTRQRRDTAKLRYSLIYLATLYIRNDQYSKALELIQNDELLWQSSNSHDRAMFHYTKANAIASMGRSEEAYKLYGLVYPIFKQTNDPYNYIQLLNNYSNTSLNVGKPDSALILNAEVLAILNSLNDNHSLGHAYFTRANIYRTIDMLDSAAAYAAKAGRLLVQIKDPDSYVSTLELWAKIESERENWKEAKLLTDKLLTLRDSILNEARLTSVDSLLLLHDVEEKEAALQAAEQENIIQKLRWQRTWIGIAALILIILTFLIVFIQRKRRQMQLLARERDQKEKDLILARKELRLKLEEISNYHSNVVELQAKLKTLNSQQLSNEEKLKRADIFNILKRNIKEETDWTLFEEYFNKANPLFLSALKNKFPSLTAHDVRLMSLVRLNLNSTEIAVLFNIAPESVRKSRYRLAKKLGLEGEKDLYPYLIGVTQGADK